MVDELVGLILRTALAAFPADHRPGIAGPGPVHLDRLFDLLVADGYLDGQSTAPLSGQPRARARHRRPTAGKVDRAPVPGGHGAQAGSSLPPEPS